MKEKNTKIDGNHSIWPTIDLRLITVSDTPQSSEAGFNSSRRPQTGDPREPYPILHASFALGISDRRTTDLSSLQARLLGRWAGPADWGECRLWDWKGT